MWDIESYIKDFSKYPQPVAKKQWVEAYDEMAVHSRKKSPTKLINKRRPYEDESVKKYRIDNYEHVTMTVITRGIERLQTILSQANVNIDIPESLSSYLSEPIFQGGNWDNFVDNFVMRRMIEDPNGLIVWFPKGKGVEIGNEKVNPVPILLLSKNIHHFDENVLTFLSDEKSEVKDNGSQKFTGKVYYIVTKESYYKYIQVGDKSKNKFELHEYYKHDLEELPVVSLGGIECGSMQREGSKGLKNQEITYLGSYFSSAVPYLNEAARQFSDHQAIMVTSAHPIREMESVPCIAEGCEGGKIRIFGDNDTDIDFKTCKTCSGKGEVIPSSPYGVLFRKRSNLFNEKQMSPTPALRYIAPPVEILKYTGDHWKDMIEAAEKAINLLFIDNAQSGKAKEIDRESLTSMLDKIGKNIYDNIYKKSYNIVHALRENSSSGAIVINLPASFRVRTEEEMVKEISELKTENSSSFIVSQSVIELIMKRYSGNRVLQKIAKFLISYDPLFPYSTSEKIQMQAAGIVSKTDNFRSLNAMRICQEIATEDKTSFLEMSFNELKTKVEEMISKIEPPQRDPIV